MCLCTDLNYRINLSDADIRTLVSEQPERGSLALLQQYDQLMLARRTKKAFSDFLEYKITHPPFAWTRIMRVMPTDV